MGTSRVGVETSASSSASPRLARSISPAPLSPAARQDPFMNTRPFSRLLLAALFASAVVGTQLARPTGALSSDEPAFVQPFGSPGANPLGANLAGASIQTGSDDSLARGPFNTATLDYDFGNAFF